MFDKKQQKYLNSLSKSDVNILNGYVNATFLDPKEFFTIVQTYLRGNKEYSLRLVKEYKSKHNISIRNENNLTTLIETLDGRFFPG
jgi:hypothetical protein